MWCTYTYNEIPISHKKGWNNAICSNMDEPRDYNIKWSKAERIRQIPYDITCMWNLKYDTKEHIYETDTKNRFVGPKGEGMEREGLGVSD